MTFIYINKDVHTNTKFSQAKNKNIISPERKHAEDKDRLFINERQQMASIVRYSTSLMIKRNPN